MVSGGGWSYGLSSARAGLINFAVPRMAAPPRIEEEITVMYWYDHDPGGWGYVLMISGMVLFWGVLITGIVLLVRFVGRDGQQRAQPPALHTAEQLLAERFARSEIDENEYLSRLTTLRGRAQP
jgi:putative membrane protein